MYHALRHSTAPDFGAAGTMSPLLEKCYARVVADLDGQHVLVTHNAYPLANPGQTIYWFDDTRRAKTTGRLDPNTSWPPVFDLIHRASFSVPVAGPVGPFALPGEAQLRCSLSGIDDPRLNRHVLASLPKMALAALADALGREYNVTNIFDDWYPSISKGPRPTVAVSIYHDDAITEGLVLRLAEHRIPLLAVISADPRRPYESGGVVYDFDPDHIVYRGRSAGRSDNFKYRPSPFASYLTMQLGMGVCMRTLCQVDGERLVLFAPGEVETRTFTVGLSRQGVEVRGLEFVPSALAVDIVLETTQRVPTKAVVTMRPSYGSIEAVRDANRVVVTTNG